MCEKFDPPEPDGIGSGLSRQWGDSSRSEADTLDYMSTMIRELRKLAEGTRYDRLSALLTLAQFEVDTRSRRCTRRG